MTFYQVYLDSLSFKCPRPFPVCSAEERRKSSKTVCLGFLSTRLAVSGFFHTVSDQRHHGSSNATVGVARRSGIYSERCCD